MPERLFNHNISRNRGRRSLSNVVNGRTIFREHLDKLRFAAAALAVLLATGQAALGADQPAKTRIAVVDVRKLESEFNEFQQRQKELQALQQQYTQTLQLLAEYAFLPKESFDEMVAIARLPQPWPQEKQKRAEDLRNISTDKEKQYLALRSKTNRSAEEEDQFKTLQELAQAREADLRQLEQQFARELMKRQDELRAQLTAKVQSAIEAVAKQKGYDIVLDREAVFFGGEDITADVLAILNAQKSGEQQEKGK
ncbi:MAG: OmpH family outer membrane protein [Armatimonadetes bacterium]|nr:OmpH family outer membrane protein [Armatimonadota bacterium]